MSNTFSISNPIYISLFKNICDTLKNFSEYLYIKFTNNYITFQLIDNIKVSISNINFAKYYFDLFNINNESIICINIIDFTKILKNFSKTTTIIFEIIDNILSIKTSDIIIKNFKINLIDASFYDWIDINTLNSNNLKLSILSKTLKTIISELNIFSDYLTIKKNKNYNILEFIINNESNNIYSQYQISDFNILSKDFTEEIENTIYNKYGDIELYISLNYLKNFKLFSDFEYTYFYISNNNPIQIQLNDTHIEINYMIAPKLSF